MIFLFGWDEIQEQYIQMCTNKMLIKMYKIFKLIKVIEFK